MADVHDPLTRSYNMSQIRNKNTTPEMIVRKYLFSRGLRYRINDIKLPGKPDIVFPKYKTVVFINGCFWHKHDNCKYFKWPKTNEVFWKEKLTRNANRDNAIYEQLKQLEWNVIVVWECELKPDMRQITLEKLYLMIKS